MMFSCLQLVISLTYRGLWKRGKSPLVDRLTGQLVGRFRGVEWGGTSVKCELSQSLWLSSARPTGQNKSVHQRVLLSLSHCFFLSPQHFTDTIEPWIEIGPFYWAPIYWWPIIGQLLIFN